MTKEELEKLPFQCVAHIALEHQYLGTYRNEEYGITIHTTTRKLDVSRYGKSKHIYVYKGNKYKNADELLKAINNSSI